MDSQDEIKELKQYISELEQQLEQAKEFPYDGVKYYYIEPYGHVSWFEWDGTEFDLQAREVGNTFRTEDEAEFTLKKLKVEAKLRKFSRPFMWGTENTAMLFDGDNIKFDTRLSYVFQGAIYFDSENKAKEAIEAVGEDSIKKYIFGMED